MADLQIQSATTIRNIALSFKGYFQAKEDLQKRKYNKVKTGLPSVVVSPIEIVPISLENLNQGDKELMKNITKRADGRYMGRKQINGTIIYAYGYTINECAKNLQKAIKKEHSNPRVKRQNYKLYDWLNIWYETYKAPFIKYKSALQIESIIKIIKSNFDNISLSNLTSVSIQKFLNSYPTTRQKELIILYFNACLQKAEDLNYIVKNPIKAVVRDKKINNKRQPFTLHEQQTILKAIKGTVIEAPILFYLVTGVRKNELNTHDLLNDIDTKNHILKVKSEKKRNNNLYREIDITNELIQLVEKNYNSFQLTTEQIYRQFKQILKEHNIKGSLHNLRHTFATNHYYLGTPAKQVQAWLGHETIELTQNIYTQLDRSISKKDILKLYNNLYFQI